MAYSNLIVQILSSNGVEMGVCMITLVKVKIKHTTELLSEVVNYLTVRKYCNF